VPTTDDRVTKCGRRCAKSHDSLWNSVTLSLRTSAMKKASQTKAKTPAKRVRAAATRGRKLAAVLTAGSKLSLRTGQTPFPIVGVGASAGGLEAFTELLSALPLETGMAFVLIQHLEAEHESMLTELLSKVTQMPVSEVRKRTLVEPNHVYVIPANADLSLADGELRVSNRKAPAGRHLPIDHFFRTLADSHGHLAIGVVLSGTASDGTLGLKAIRAAGGITFAQEPKTAKFDGMPRSALLAGCVDFVLSPQRIAMELSHVVFHPAVAGPDREIGEPLVAAWDEDWIRMFKLLRDAAGLDFTFYKKATISRRVARRMAMKNVEKLSEYVNDLKTDPEELNALYRDLLIQVTSFFRDPAVFRALRNRILPQILSRRSLSRATSSDSIRIWVPGCSSGEEAYSIAISLLEKLGDRASSTSIQIFATDISEQAIDKARAGVYSKEALAKVSKQRVQRFFTRVNGSFQITSGVRDLCIFARHDLIKDPPFSRMDLISCRNVLIYLEPVLQRKILAAFSYALDDGGFLLLGKSETSGALPDFRMVDRKNKFFARVAAAPVRESRPMAAEKPAGLRKHYMEETPPFDLEKEADRIIWERSRNAGLVVNDALEILHFRGDTSPYLRPLPGKATFQLLRMVREELVLELRGAINKARKTGASVRKEAIRAGKNGDSRLASIEVRPLPARRAGNKYFLILFEYASSPEDSSVTSAGRQPPPAHYLKPGRDKELAEVKNDLIRTRDYLQAVIQEHERANDELKAANEEAQSSMEELHSTNEELETAKEELQSSNEELVTLNEQLQKRNTELARLSDELSNVLAGVDIPILILGADLRIRRFTPQAEKLLRLLPGDVGRPLSHIRMGVNLPALEESIAQVNKGVRDVWREVKADDSRWYSVRILPFLTAERRIDGALIVFVDVNDLKQINERKQKEQKLIAGILDAARDLLVVVLDGAGHIVQFNRAAQELTGYSLEEARGRRLWDFLPIPEERGQLKKDFEEVVKGGKARAETHWLTKRGQRRLIAVFDTVAVTDGGRVEYVIRTGMDVTDREEAQEQARDSEAAIRALLETAPEAVLAHNSKGRIVFANAAAEAIFGYKRRELVGQLLAILIPQRFRQRHAQQVKKFFKEQSARPMGVDLFGLRKDGSEFPANIGLSYFKTKDGALGVSFVADITDRKRIETTLLQNQKELQALTARLLSLQEAGNKELARELHDDLSQKLAALGMEVSTLLQPSVPPAQLPRRVRALSLRIKGMAEEAHALSRRLHPAVLDELGLEAALKEECTAFSAQSGNPCAIEFRSVPVTLPGDVALCLYRVAQESLRNIARHTRAAQVRVALSGRNGGIALRIEDTGKGFDLETVRGKGGLGLISMEERVRLLHGSFTIQSARGAGTTVNVLVPLARKKR
jgi:two-component system CheB/CheR fusion protein